MTTLASDLTARQAQVLADLAFAGPTVATTPTVRALAHRGLLQPTDTPNLYSLTETGALLALACLAGWDIPADIVDGYVVILCARCALANAVDNGADSTMARAVIDGLLSNAGFQPLAPDATPYRQERV